MPDVSLRQYPLPEMPPAIVALQTMTALYIIMAYSLFVHFLVVNLVAEKENQIKECMRLMGMRDSAFWSVLQVWLCITRFTTHQQSLT
jgi:ATP-binding cassette subfamily A (ABC1) protein 5